MVDARDRTCKCDVLSIFCIRQNVAETCAGKLVVRANLIGDTDFYTELVIRN
jgi:hypothetical protein